MPNINLPTRDFEILFSLRNLKDIRESLNCIGVMAHYEWAEDEFIIRYDDSILTPRIGDILVYSNGKLSIKKGDGYV